MGTKCPPLVLRCVFIRLAYCMLWCKIVCKMLTYIINNLALSKIEDVKRYYKNDWIQNIPYLASGGCSLGWPTVG
jgi:hypothetical protein